VQGFDRLLDTCRTLGIGVELGQGAMRVPETILGTPLDGDLARLLATHDGCRLRLGGWRFTLYPVGTDEGLVYQNEGLRRLSNDYLEPYPFSELVVFAQKGLQATYFATVPKLANSSGRHPVILVDTHEDPWALPIASSVDGTFTLLARYLDFAIGRSGPEGPAEYDLPFDVPQLLVEDGPLRSLVQSGALDPFVRGDSVVQEWVRQTFDSGR